MSSVCLGCSPGGKCSSQCVLCCYCEKDITGADLPEGSLGDIAAHYGIDQEGLSDFELRNRILELTEGREVARLIDIGFDAASKAYDTPVTGGQLDRSDPMNRSLLHGVAAMIVASKKAPRA